MCRLLVQPVVNKKIAMALIPRVIFKLNLFGRNARNQSYCIASSRWASTATKSSGTESLAEEVIDEDKLAAAAELEAKRNKSRLRSDHYKMLHGQVPVDPNGPKFEYHETVHYQRKQVARYGSASGIYPGIAWPTRQELKGILEYEKAAHPLTLQEMVENKRKERQMEKDVIMKRYDMIWSSQN